MGFKVAVSLLLAVALPCFATANTSYGNGGWKDCPYGMLKNVPHGEWYTGAVKICLCNDGEWEQCYDKSGVVSPPYVPPVSPPYVPPPYVPASCYDNGASISDGQWHDLYDGRSCYCNDGQWSQCRSPPYVPPPYVPASCYDNGASISDGQWHDLYDGRSCYCNDGQWSQCRNKFAPPPYVPPKGCNDWPDKIPHNQWHKRNGGKECLCSDGSWIQCKNPPNKCFYKGKSVYNGGFLDKETQRCRCNFGNLVDCEDLCKAGKSQLMFLFDTSKSITEDKDSSSDGQVGEENWRAMQDFTASAIRQLPIGPWKTMVSLTRFSDRSPTTRLSFRSSDSGDKNAILRNLYDWEPPLKGGTYLGRALDYVQDEYTSNYQWAKILVILTDGNADDEIEHVAQDMRRDGYIIWAVGVGKNIEFDKLLLLTADGNRILLVDSFEALTRHIEFLSRAVCFNYNI